MSAERPKPKLGRLPPRIATLGSTLSSIPAAPAVASWRTDKRTAAQRGYGGKWQRYRLGWLRKHPLCGDRLTGASPEHSACVRDGRVTPGTVVDHVEDHRGDQKLFWNPENHQTLCTHCHDSFKRTVQAQVQRA
jgi:5-methylcytosine-specific restriction enzyme A